MRVLSTILILLGAAMLLYPLLSLAVLWMQSSHGSPYHDTYYVVASVWRIALYLVATFAIIGCGLWLRSRTKGS